MFMKCLISVSNTITIYLTCSSEIQEDDFLVVADSYQQHLYQIGTETEKVNPIVTSELYRPIAVGFDPNTLKVYWTDNEAKVVKSASIYGRSEIILRANPEGKITFVFMTLLKSLGPRINSQNSPIDKDFI